MKNIEWTDRSINPIKGRCKGGCWYCWTEGFYNRKFLDSEIRLKPSVFFSLPKKPKRVFLCSTHDLFGDWIPKEWRDLIFDTWIPNYSQHTFQILTKYPQNIDRPMPENVWLGVSITGNTREDNIRADYFGYLPRKAKIQFISYEPILEPPVYNIPNIDWVILGRLTGHGHKYDPQRDLIEKLAAYAELNKGKVFLKNNLKEIWGEPLIQEFPE